LYHTGQRDKAVVAIRIAYQELQQKRLLVEHLSEVAIRDKFKSKKLMAMNKKNKGSTKGIGVGGAGVGGGVVDRVRGADRRSFIGADRRTFPCRSLR
jgi:hypothetical protein